MYMKSFKDFRRRSVETVLVTVGASERTVDEDFGILHQNFEALSISMNNCCKASNDSLEHQKSASEETSEFSKLLSKMYSEQLDTEQNGSKWPHSSCALKNSLLSRKYVESCVDAHNIIQASCSTVCREEGLDPYKGAALTMGPAVEETCKLRNKMLTDFDSYRRRLKTLEAKKASTEATAKEKAINDLNAEISKYIGKVASAEQAYTEFNEQTKGDIIVNRVSHDELLDNLLVATIVSQADMHLRIANQLQQLVSLCPPEQVSRIRSQIDVYVGRGGPPVTKEDTSSSSSLLNTLRGGNNKDKGYQSGERRNSKTGPPASGYLPEDPESERTAAAKSAEQALPSAPQAYYTAPVLANPDYQRHVANTGVESGVFESKEQGGHSQSQGQGHDPSQWKSSSVPLRSETDSSLPVVIALYDHEADADDELNFSAGDHVEVLEAGDGGWWKGRCRGQTGLFPVNYVQAVE